MRQGYLDTTYGQLHYRTAGDPGAEQLVKIGCPTLVATLISGFPDPNVDSWRFTLLGGTTLANVVLVFQLIFSANRVDLRRAARLLLVHIGIIFLLSGIARLPDQNIPLQWLAQILNTIAQGLFLIAVWKLRQRWLEERESLAAS